MAAGISALGSHRSTECSDSLRIISRIYISLGSNNARFLGRMHIFVEKAAVVEVIKRGVGMIYEH